jgi:transposase
MTDNGDDYVPPDDNEGSPVRRTLRRRSRDASDEVGRPESSRKRVRTTREPLPVRSTCLPNDLPSLRALKEPVNRLLRKQDYNEGLSLRVIRAALTIQEDWLEECKKKGEGERGKRIPKPNVRASVCRLFGVAPVTYGSIMGKYLNHKEVYSSENGGNTRPKQTRIPMTKGVQVAVRNFVRGYRLQRKRVTGRQVLDFLVEKGFLVIQHEHTGGYEKESFRTAYRNVRLWMSYNGYKRGKRKGSIRFKDALIVERDLYLRAFFDNRTRCERMLSVPVIKGLREVYLDESYIHHHYHRNDDSCWDPNDDQDIQVGKAPAKGNRYCFLAAIQGADPRVKDPLLPEEKAGMVVGSLWAFCPQRKGDHKGDYHKVFNSKNFIEWWKQQLLPNLKQPSLILMDNAKYHKTYPSSVPKVSQIRKAAIQEYLESKGVAYGAKDTVAILRDIARKTIETMERRECVLLAEEQGHTVMFTPSYHSDIQPIELLWAKVKGQVGRQYDINTTLALVYERLMTAFEEVTLTGHDSIAGMIRKAASIAMKFYEGAQVDGGEDGEEEVVVVVAEEGKEQEQEQDESERQDEEEDSERDSDDDLQGARDGEASYEEV